MVNSTLSPTAMEESSNSFPAQEGPDLPSLQETVLNLFTELNELITQVTEEVKNGHVLTYTESQAVQQLPDLVVAVLDANTRAVKAREGRRFVFGPAPLLKKSRRYEV